MGDYFANPDLAGEAAAQRRDRPINFDFSRGRLPPDVPAQNISIRWTGELLTTLGGEYHLVVSGRGGFRLKLGGETIIDAWTPEEQTRSVTRLLGENAALPLVLEYRQGDAPAKISLQWEIPDAASGFADALALAKKADAIVFVGGISAQLEGEEMTVDYEGFQGGDRTTIELPAVQQKLLQALRGTGKPTVGVMMSGSALAMPWADANLNALLEAWYPGQAAGTAVADVLLGRINPAGRLPITFYRATSDLPEFTDYRMENRTYRYFKGTPLYAFGHGLSYTKFDYAKPTVSAKAGDAPRIFVNVDVTNSGAMDGDEVVQVYLAPPEAREREALAGFARVHLARGEKQVVKVEVPATALRRWSSAKHEYVVPRGEWRVMVGASSADIRQSATVRID
jgi:beta-glucosidase